METNAFDLIEEFQSEDIMSVNHSRTIQRISVHFEQYDDDFDIRTPDGQKLTFTEGIIKDPATGIDIPFNKIFRTMPK